MLEISIRLLAGRYHATPWDRHPREGEPEWPPSTWRLLRALAASYYRNPGQFDLEQVLSITRLLASPPEYHLPAASAAHTRQYFPQANPGDKQLLFDGFVRTGDEDVILLRWPDLELDDRQFGLLESLLRGVTYFGRAESWAELSASTQRSNLPTNCSLTSKSENTESVRVLAADAQVTWPQLTIQTGQLQKEGWSSPPGSRWLTYYRPIDCFHTPRKSKVRDFHPVAIRYAYLRPVRPRIANGIFAAAAMRADFLHLLDKAKVETEVWEGFAGKRKDGSGLLDGHAHPYILPFPSTQSNFLGEVLIYRRTPSGTPAFPEQSLHIFTKELSRLHKIQQRSFKVQFVELLDHTRLTTLPAFQPSQVWQSLTPFVQTRFLKPGRETLEDQVRRELRNHSGPSDLLTSVEILERAIDGICLRDFKTQRQNRPRPTAGIHNLRLRFSEPVGGPIMLGYGAHFGLGQFRPV